GPEGSTSAHGGPHVPFYRSSADHRADHSKGRTRKDLLLRYDTGESRSFPARRELFVGLGAARFVNRRLLDGRRGGSYRGDRLLPYEPGYAGHGLYDAALRKRAGVPFQSELDVARKNSSHYHRGHQQDADLGRPRSGSED